MFSPLRNSFSLLPRSVWLILVQLHMDARVFNAHPTPRSEAGRDLGIEPSLGSRLLHLDVMAGSKKRIRKAPLHQKDQRQRIRQETHQADLIQPQQ